MTDLTDVWSDFGSKDEDSRYPVTSGMKSTVASSKKRDDSRPNSAEDVIRDFMTLQAQRQKRELVVGVCALVLFTVVINHLDRLHTRLRTLEMMLSLM